MRARINLFLAWFFILQTLALGWIAAAGRGVLELVAGVTTPEEGVPGRIVGVLLLLGVLFIAQHFLRGLPPQGRPSGSGYTLGHRLLAVGSVLAALLFLFQFFAGDIADYNTHLVLNKFTTAFGYLAMGFFAVGFSMIYQSALPEKQ